MKWEVRISYKKGVQDSEGESTLSGLAKLGFVGLKGVGTARVYVIEGDYRLVDVEEMCEKLLANPVSQDYLISEVK